MMHKVWSRVEDISHYFSRSSVKFQGHRDKKMIDFDPNWDFLDCNSSLNSQMAMKCWSSIEEVPNCFRGHPSKVTRDKYRRFWAKLSVFGLSLQCEFTDGFQMIYEASSYIEEVRYCFSRSSIKFQGHTGQKIPNFDPNLAFLDCNSSLNSPMGLKWCTKLDVVQKRCSIVFRGHPSNFKVTWTEKSMILIQF